MKKRISKTMHFVPLLIWFGIIGLGLASFLTLNPSRAHAADSAKTAAVKPIRPLKITSPDLDRIYFDGQTVTLQANYGRADLKVTANLSMIDRAMPSNFPLEGKNGIYTLVTPALSAETMTVGQTRWISLMAEDPAGQITTTRKAYFINVRFQTIKPGAAVKKPTITTAEAGNEQVKIAWEPAPAAKGYAALYKDHLKVSRQIVVPEDNTNVTIGHLQNDFTYRFSVVGRDIKGRKGSASVVMLTPRPPAPVAISLPPPVEEIAPEKVVRPAIAGGKSIIASPKIAKEEVKQEEPPPPTAEPKPAAQAQPRNWNRLLVAISILIIAAGAAIGGYYGYEWWVVKKEEEGEETKPKTDKTSNRW